MEMLPTVLYQPESRPPRSEVRLSTGASRLAKSDRTCPEINSHDYVILQPPASISPAFEPAISLFGVSELRQAFDSPNRLMAGEALTMRS